MSFNQTYHHNPATCPEVVATASAEQKARTVRQQNEAIPKANRGTTQFVNLELDDLAKSEDLMVNNATNQVAASTVFANSLEAKKYREELLDVNATQDITIPNTEDERRAHVKILFQAFKCVPSACGESDAIKKPFIDHAHDNILVECLCWDVLDACILRSQVLANLVDSREPGKYKFKKGLSLSFQERFDLLVVGMGKSKSLCKHMFDAPFMFKVIDDPQNNVDRIESNRKLNGQKAQVMKRGKEAVAADADQNGQRKKRKTNTQQTAASTMPEPRRQQQTSTVQSSTQTPTPSQRYFDPPQRSAPPAPRVMVPPQSPYQVNAQSSGFMPPNPNSSFHPTTPSSSRVSSLDQYVDNGERRTLFSTAQVQSYATGYGSNAAYLPQQYPVQSMPTMPTMPTLSAMGQVVYATPSNLRTLQTLPSSAPTSSHTSTASRVSSQYPDPDTPDRRGAGWLAQPQREAHSHPGSGYSSRASTVSASQLGSGVTTPDYKPASQLSRSSSGNRTDIHEDGPDDMTMRNGHFDMNDFMQDASLEQENQHDLDAPYEDDDDYDSEDQVHV